MPVQMVAVTWGTMRRGVRSKQQYIVQKSQQEADDSASAIYDAIAGTSSQQGLQGMHKVSYVAET